MDSFLPESSQFISFTGGSEIGWDIPGVSLGCQTQG